VTKEDRVAQRQRVLDERDEIQQLDLEDRRKLRHKQLQYGSDLIGQMEYEQCRRQADRVEEAKLIERQEIAEKEWNDQLHDLMQNPVAFKRHPTRQKYDEMTAALPALSCVSTREVRVPADEHSNCLKY
jgi:hypothetical protein